MFAGNESNSIDSSTTVFDRENKTKTIHKNQLVGEYDFYLGVDATLLLEVPLMVEAESSPFDIGKRMGIGILKGEVKIKPFWKIYKILSILKAMGGTEEELSRGVSSEIS